MPLTEDKKHFIINAESEFKLCGQWLRSLFAEYPYVVISAKKGRDRTLEQNSMLWALLTDISNQVKWFEQYHTPEDWKDIITGSLKQGRFVPGIEGGFVVVGMRTSKMTRQVFSELVNYIFSFGAEKGVVWSETAEDVFSEFVDQKHLHCDNEVK